MTSGAWNAPAIIASNSSRDGRSASALMSSADSSLAPRDPPFSTSSGFVRDGVAQRLGGAGDVALHERDRRWSDEELLEPVGAGRADGEPGQGVLVHLVLGIARAQCRRAGGPDGRRSSRGTPRRTPPRRYRASTRSRRRSRPCPPGVAGQCQSQLGHSSSVAVSLIRCTPPFASTRGSPLGMANTTRSDRLDEPMSQGHAPRLAELPFTLPRGAGPAVFGEQPVCTGRHASGARPEITRPSGPTIRPEIRRRRAAGGRCRRGHRVPSSTTR